MKYNLERDYYKELGVAKNIEQEGLEDAVRRLLSNQSFDDIKQKAFRILSDTTTRRKYDNGRRLQEIDAEMAALVAEADEVSSPEKLANL